MSQQVSQLDSLRGGSDGWIIFRLQRRVEGCGLGGGEDCQDRNVRRG